MFSVIDLDLLMFRKYTIDWNYFDISKPFSTNIKIIQLSDLHIHTLRPFHITIAKKINTLKPDIIFFTGDMVNETAKVPVLGEFMELIDNSIKKFAITGNWEYSGHVDFNILKRVYLKNNCQLLINENKTLIINGRKITIIGIDDYLKGNPDFKQAVKNKEKADTIIVLTHCPAHRDTITIEKGDLKIDLILAGHTHGGQITFMGFAPLVPKGSAKYLKGWYTDIEPKMYISRGIGTSTLPIRLGARAEVVEMDV